jgi:hypothetical protein
MRKLLAWIAATASLVLVSATASAAVPVPEIDAGSAVMAMGLVAGVVALIRERR